MLIGFHRRRWDALARTDPLWAILSEPGRRGGGWDLEECCDSGEAQIRALVDRLVEIRAMPGTSTALDFGCGAGRLTRALATRFRETVGVDISPSMVALAERHNPFPERCRFETWDGRRLPFPNGHFSLVISLITLQHMPPRTARRALGELGRVLALGGTLAFQTAAEPVSGPTLPDRLLPRSVYELVREVKSLVAPAADFEMYGVPRAMIEDSLAEWAMRITAVDEDAAAGPGWRSFTYVAVKPNLR